MRGEAGDVLTVEDDLALLDRAQACNGVDQLVLTVAVDAGQRHDLTGMHLDDALRTAGRSRSSLTLRPRSWSTGRSGIASVFSTRNSTGRPTIIWAIDSSVCPSTGTVPTISPRRSTEMRSAIDSTSFSFVRDHDDRHAFVTQLADDVEQFLDLLRCEHRGGSTRMRMRALR